MPSLMVRSMLAASLLAACGDNQEPDPVDEAVIEVDHDPEDMAPPPSLSLVGFVSFSSPDCDRATLGYEAVVRYTDDSPVTDLECTLTFDDGATSNDCVGTHTFAEGGVKVVGLVARDRSTGAVLSVVNTGFIYDPIRELTVFANKPGPFGDQCGLEFSWGASYFGNPTEVLALFSPPENIVDSSSANRILVSEPGTYTVTVRLEQERTTGPICTYVASASVDVVACPDDHEHEPGCGH